MKLHELTTILTEANIDISTWGTGKAKTLQHLLTEIENGESILDFDSEGNLTRTIRIVGAVISFSRYVLIERKQIFNDGRKRERNLETSVAEKVIPGENSKQAILRCLKEELGISGEVEKISPVSEKIDTQESPSYPGLRTTYHIITFDIIILKNDFNKDGYVETQEDKKTYFVWKKT